MWAWNSTGPQCDEAVIRRLSRGGSFENDGCFPKRALTCIIGQDRQFKNARNIDKRSVRKIFQTPVVFCVTLETECGVLPSFPISIES